MEIKAQELRIGNLINTIPYPCYVTTADAISAISDYGLKAYGIPLTQEWLFKFGFKSEGSGGKCFIKNNFSIYSPIYIDDWFSPSNIEFVNVRISYVHQLQNIYYALYNKELTVKEDNL